MLYGVVRCEQRWWFFVCLLLYYIPAISTVISGPVPTCDNAHSWWLYSAAPLEGMVTNHDSKFHSVTFSWHCANQSLPYPSNAECLTRNRQVSILKSSVWFDQGSNTRRPSPPISKNGRLTTHSVIPSGPVSRELEEVWVWWRLSRFGLYTRIELLIVRFGLCSRIELWMVFLRLDK